MKLPKYIKDPKPGVKDSIRKWEWIKKQTEIEDEYCIGDSFVKYWNHFCGLCVEAGRNDDDEFNCHMCKWPGKKNTRCISNLNQSSKFRGLIETYNETSDLFTEKDRKYLISICDKMLKVLYKIKKN